MFARTISAERLTIQLAELFSEAGINHVMLKGAVFAHWLFDNPGERVYGDCDVWVKPGQVDRAERILKELGFELYWDTEFADKRPRLERDWVRSTDDARVDLHMTIPGVGTDHAETWAIMSRHRDEVTIGGSKITTLDETANSLHAVLHVAQHGRRVGKPKEDLDRVFERMSAEAWSEVASLARELDAVEWLSSGLRLHERGVPIAEQLSLPEPSSLEVIMRSESAPPLTDSFLWIAGLGWRQRIAYVFRSLFPSPGSMRTVSPLARRGPVSLFLAYPWRWWWLARRVPDVVRAWRTARRSRGSRDA
jgi:hypothetical protein